MKAILGDLCPRLPQEKRPTATAGGTAGVLVGDTAKPLCNISTAVTRNRQLSTIRARTGAATGAATGATIMTGAPAPASLQQQPFVPVGSMLGLRRPAITDDQVQRQTSVFVGSVQEPARYDGPLSSLAMC